MGALRITNRADADQILEHFNGFHDGFIKRLEVTSRDQFSIVEPGDPAIAHELTGRFDAVIDIAHYNYPVGALQPFDQAIRCRFADVRDLCLDLRGIGESNWPIKVVEIDAAADDPARFTLVFHWSHLVNNEWSTRSAQLMTFTTAEFEELSLS